MLMNNAMSNAGGQILYEIECNSSSLCAICIISVIHNP